MCRLTGTNYFKLKGLPGGGEFVLGDRISARGRGYGTARRIRIAYASFPAPELWRRLAGYIDQILRGAKPGDIAAYREAKFALLVNLKAAKALGLTIPPSLLARADE